jgi:hypothetical protein
MFEGGYYNSGWKYAATSVAAARYEMNAGVHSWYNAPSGTAGNAITFTQAMALTSGGNLLVGTTTDFGSKAVISGANGTAYSSTPQLRISGRSTNNNRAAILFSDDALQDGKISYYPAASAANSYFSFSARSTESDMILDGSGNLSVGTTTATTAGGSYTAITANGSSGSNLALNGGGTNIGLLYAATGNGNLYLTNQTASGNMIFAVGSGSERARIDSSGNFMVGTTGNSTYGEKFNVTTGSATQTIMNLVASGTSAFGAVKFRNGSGEIGSISYLSGGVVYNVTSDYRLKTVVGAVSGSGERIDLLKPIDYRWKESNEQVRGFLAHEFKEIYPNSVIGEKDDVDADGNPVYQSMQASTSEVIADLVAEIQSLRKRLADAGIA